MLHMTKALLHTQRTMGLSEAFIASQKEEEDYKAMLHMTKGL